LIEKIGKRSTFKLGVLGVLANFKLSPCSSVSSLHALRGKSSVRTVRGKNLTVIIGFVTVANPIEVFYNAKE